LSKIVNDPRPNVGDTITFTITLTNNGPDTATNVDVTDVLPDGLTLVSDSPSQGIYNAGTGLWIVGNLANGAQATLIFRATVISPNPQTNTASITAADQPDPNDTNNTASATATPQQADLEIAKTVSNPTPNVGDVITFTVTLTNLGPDAATGVAVLDQFPAGLDLISASPSEGTYDAASGVWTVGIVTITTPETLVFTARVISPEAETNTASISAADQFDPNGANNQAEATATPQQADLLVTKTVDNSTPNVGDTINFVITVANIGPDAATHVQLTDVLPAGLSLLANAPSQGTYTAASGVWDVGTLALGGSATLHLQARVESPNTQTNTAEITHSDQFDPDLGNNQASQTTTPQQADLAVGKSVSNPTPNVGDIITYTIHLTNDGPDAATGVTLQDILPAQVSFQSFTATEGSYDSNTNTWTVGSVAFGATETLIITVLVTSPNPAPNTASISHADQFDPNQNNNSSTASVNPQRPTWSWVRRSATPGRM